MKINKTKETLNFYSKNYNYKISIFMFSFIFNVLRYIFKIVEEIKNKQLIFIGKFEKVINNKNEIIEEIQQFDFSNLIDNNYLIYAKDKNENKIIYYNKKYFCNELQDFKIFYIFDTSLDKNKRGRKKKSIDLENIKIDNSLNKIGKKKYLNKKRKMEIKYEKKEGEN